MTYIRTKSHKYSNKDIHNLTYMVIVKLVQLRRVSAPYFGVDWDRLGLYNFDVHDSKSTPLGSSIVNLSSSSSIWSSISVGLSLYFTASLMASLQQNLV